MTGLNEKQHKLRSVVLPGREFTVQNRALCFLPGDRRPKATAGDSLLGRLQDFFKGYGRLYSFLVTVFAPVLGTHLMQMVYRTLREFGPEAVILNLGSGPHTLDNRADVVNVDLYAFDQVDMVCDAADIPVQDNSVDLIVNTALLEHVPNPEVVVREMHRVVKVRGKIVCYLPFLVPFHAAPFDYHRWTLAGARELFRDFEQVQAGVGAGPTSGLLYVFQQWAALTLSLGSKKLHDVLFILLLLTTWPIKLLDLILIRHPFADKVASGFYVIAQK